MKEESKLATTIRYDENENKIKPCQTALKPFYIQIWYMHRVKIDFNVQNIFRKEVRIKLKRYTYLNTIHSIQSVHMTSISSTLHNIYIIFSFTLTYVLKNSHVIFLNDHENVIHLMLLP